MYADVAHARISKHCKRKQTTKRHALRRKQNIAIAKSSRILNCWMDFSQEQHRIEMEHLTKEIENLRSVLRSRNENSSESELQATIQELNELQVFISHFFNASYFVNKPIIILLAFHCLFFTFQTCSCKCFWIFIYKNLTRFFYWFSFIFRTNLRNCKPTTNDWTMKKECCWILCVDRLENWRTREIRSEVYKKRFF